MANDEFKYNPYFTRESAFEDDPDFARVLRERALGAEGGFAGQELRDQTAYGLQAIDSRMATSRAMSPGARAAETTRQRMMLQQQARGTEEQLALEEQLSAQEQLLGREAAQDEFITGMYGLEARRNIAGEEQRLGEAIRDQKAAQVGAGSFLTGVGTAAKMMAMSDETAKQGIKDTSPDELDSFLDALRARDYTFRRRAVDDGGRPHTGVVTQELGESRLGRRLVDDAVDESGEPREALNVPDSLGAALAGLGRLNERLNMLEEELQNG